MSARLTGCAKPSPMTQHFRAMLREPAFTEALYRWLVDPAPVVGYAQQACELDRRLGKEGP